MPVSGVCAGVLLWLVASLGTASMAPSEASPEAAVSAPVGEVRFRSFRAAEGLRNLVVVAMTQDARGNLWIGTDEGAYRYDGTTFLELARSSGLRSSHVAALAPRPEGGVCAVGDTGLACGDEFGFVAVADPALRGEVISVAGADGELWVATKRGLAWRRAGQPFARVEAWGESEIQALSADEHGAIASDGSRIGMSDRRGDWTLLSPLPAGAEPVRRILRDAQGAIWLRSPSQLWYLAPGDGRATPVAMPELPPQQWMDLALGPGQAVTLATSRGLLVRESGGWRVIGREDGLPNLAARALFRDAEGSLWVSAGGLHQWLGRGLIEQHGEKQGLPGESVWAIGRDRNGELWLGTDRCLAVVDHGRFVCVPQTQGFEIRALVELPDGSAYFGGVPAVLWRRDPSGQVRPVFDAVPTGVQQILDLELGPTGDLWMGTGRGLYHRAETSPGPFSFVPPPPGSERGWISSIARTSDTLWVSGRGGLVSLRGGAWTSYSLRHGLLDSRTSYLVARRDGRVCVAYDEALGLTCFLERDGELTEVSSLSPADGLSAGLVYFLGEDAAGRLWVGTGAGVDVQDSVGAIDHFTTRDGLAGDDSNANAFFADIDGSVWLGSSTGLSRVHARHYHGLPPPPAAAVVRVRVGASQRELAFGEEISHDDQPVTVELAAPSTMPADAVELAVRLLPLSPIWTTTQLRSEHYVSLPPGEYRVETRARLRHGPWGRVASRTLIVRPAFWQTRWFLAVAIALGLALLTGVVLARQRVVLRRQQRAHLARAEETFRDLIDRLPELVLVLRPQGPARGGPSPEPKDEPRHAPIEYGNLAARKLFGVLSPSDWAAVYLLESIHAADLERARGLFVGAAPSSTLPGAAAGTVEVRLRAADGSWRELELAVQDAEVGGRPAQLVIGRDVTDRKRLQRQVLVADRMFSLGTLATGIAHEINNPLACVMGNVAVAREVLEAGEEASAEGKQELLATLGDAYDGAERVRKIVLGLRSLSRADEDRRIAVPLAPLIERAVQLAGNELRHRATVVTELAARAEVLGDEGRLTQVVVALLVNAAQAMPAGRAQDNRISVRTSDGEGTVVLDIEDTGSGIAASVLPRVFDPFFTTKAVGSGAGLGLSICHGIVTSLGGQITVESIEGHGTHVRVVLPACAERPGEPSEPAAPSAAGEVRSVLVVDDDQSVAQALRRMLERNSICGEVTLVASGAEALSRLRGGRRYDVILCDVMMPEQSGLELYDQIRALDERQARRLLFMTGGAFATELQRRLEELGRPCLSKPLQLEELRRVLAEVVVSERVPAVA